MSNPFSRPGSRTVYTTAPRYGLPNPSDTPAAVSPASYDNNKNGIVAREENVAPFDTSEIRGRVKYDDIPGPGRYNPWKRPRVEIGTLPFNGRGFKCPDTTYDTAGPGPAYKLTDPWIQTLIAIYHECFTKRPRVQYEKFVSNNAPTICHPQDVRCFVKGGDGRMYPWRRPKRVPKIPGPKYNTYGIYTSLSPGPYTTDFRNVAERGDVFKAVQGFGAADFDTSGHLENDQGVFLGKTDDPNRSIPRYFDILMRRACINKSPGPLEYWLPGSFDKMSPKAVSAPFKSGVPILGFPKEELGCGPAGYFDTHMTEADLDIELYPYHNAEPPEKAPFDSTAERFAESLYEQRPGPDAYCIHGFTDMMRYFTFRHRPAVINPKLGFLCSADARPQKLFKHSAFSLDAISYDPPSVPKKWRNLRPAKMPSFPYHGAPPKGADSPGPIYDSNPGTKACKARKDWFNPRDYTGTGFDNSGCGRVIDFALDKGIPGPKYLPPYSIPDMAPFRGRVTTTEPRFVAKKPFGPGPRHKPHEKTGSMWRATQLGSRNTYLKGIGELRPSAGGYQPQGPIDHLADVHQGYLRLDDYAPGEINPKTALDV